MPIEEIKIESLEFNQMVTLFKYERITNKDWDISAISKPQGIEPQILILEVWDAIIKIYGD